MLHISALAARVGLSRSTLLYYEKLGLIRGQRQGNGYRSYGEQDVQRLQLILKLQAGGLTLKECIACLDARIDRELLERRLRRLDEEIARKQQSRQLLAALLGEGALQAWHAAVDQVAPDAHLAWLMKQGFSEKDALRLKWLSKDMNEHEQYMADFMQVFASLDRWGPGSDKDTLRALAAVPFQPRHILEIGCGRGIATTVLAAHTSAKITVLDNEASALARVTERATEAGVASRVETVCASMTEMPFAAGSFDLIWCESSAYVMGVEKALAQWQRFLRPGGVLMFSDLVWRTATPSAGARAFWQGAYPDMSDAASRQQQAQAAGYALLDSFVLSDEAWQAYAGPLQARVSQLRGQLKDSAALQDLEAELEIYRKHLGEFGYQMFVLRKPA